jgi:hypothetical protein
MAPAHNHHPVLFYLNESTKWVVSATAAAVAAHRRDAAVGWAIIGAVASAFLNKAAKRALNQRRPDSAAGRKADPGMPSSHANSLAFLGTSAAIGLGGMGCAVAGRAVLLAAAGLVRLFLFSQNVRVRFFSPHSPTHPTLPNHRPGCAFTWACTRPPKSWSAPPWAPGRR